MLKLLILSFLEAIDIFAIVPATLFTYKMKMQYSTCYTKTMTILVVIISVLGFCYFSWNFIQKENPQNALSEEYTINPSPLYMNRENFMINFAIQNKTNNLVPFFDETVYKPEAFLQIRENENITYNSLEIGACEMKDLPSEDPELNDYFEKRNYQKMYCFKNYSQVLMNGTWDSAIFKEILIKIRPCNNKTDEMKCKTKEFISQAIEGSFLVLQYTSVVLDLNNYEKPLKVFAVNDFQPLSLFITTNMYLYFSKMTVETDTGLIQQQLTSQYGVNLISEKFNLYLNSDDDAFINFYLRLDRVNKKITRGYDKLQNVLSNVGGLMRFFTLLGSLILQPFLKEALLQRVSNDIFDFGEFAQEGRNKVKKLSSCGSPNATKKLKLTYWQYVKSKLKKENKFNRKSEILYTSINEMKKNLDISLILNKFFDLENMRQVFERKHFKEMSYFSKPKIQTHIVTEEVKSEPDRYQFKEKPNIKTEIFVKKAQIHFKKSSIEEKTKQKTDNNIKISLQLVESSPFHHLNNDDQTIKEDQKEGDEWETNRRSINLENIVENRVQSEGFQKIIDCSITNHWLDKKKMFSENL